MREQPHPDKYLDIINLPHYTSIMRPHLPRRNRAAQFAPFAALRGYEEAIQEASRVTEKRVELDEQWIAMQNVKLQKLLALSAAGLSVNVGITYFVPDLKKDGGQYKKVRGLFKRLDQSERVIVLGCGENSLDVIRIPFADIMDMEDIE